MTARKPWEEGDEAVAQFFSASPDLYRALAAVEWCGPCAEGYRFCPACHGCHSEDWRARYGVLDGHRDSCTLALALAKARGESK